MPRKNQNAIDTAKAATNAVADVPQDNATEGQGPAEGEAKNWGNPYKSIFSTADFELGENRRFKQRVFTFKEKPSEEMLAALKERGFTYRASEKAWTIQADADTRKLSDELAREFAGQAVGMGR